MFTTPTTTFQHSTRHTYAVLVFGVILLCALFLHTDTFAQQALTCNLYTQGTAVPSGFGAPWNVHVPTSLLVSVSCDSAKAEVRLGDGSDTTYVYKAGYVWRGGSWQPLTYTGSDASGEWLKGAAGTVLTRTSSEVADQPSYVLGYTCRYYNNAWRCGCRTTSCSSSGYWQIQAWRYPSSDNAPPAATPTLQVSSTPSSIQQGGNATITWSSTNSSSCAASGLTTGGLTSGSVAVTPSVTTTYTIACTGAGGTATKSTTVTVTSASTGGSTTDTTASGLFGVTIDDISSAASIKDSLASLATRPTARIVFDEFVQPSYYKSTVADLSKVADIMGELLDSFYVKDYTQAQYEQRTRDYLASLGDTVAIWEVGNEINGEWLGTGAAQKAVAAYDIVKAAGKKTALTLYYNGTYDNGKATANNCWEKPQHQMQVWAQNNIPTHMKQGLDYVLVSYYEDDCENIQPNWKPIFEELHTMFPNAKLGMGEVGSNKTTARKEEILRKYYGMERLAPYYIGGNFWWYYKQDMVPKTKYLWGVLNTYAQTWGDRY